MPVRFNRRAIEARVKKAVGRGLLSGAEAVKNNATTRMENSPPTGREYRRRGVVHIASSPGNAPRIDTGNLRRNVIVGLNLNQLVATVNFASKYAAPLEFGTEKIEPRPFARPAAKEERPRVNKFINEEVRAELMR